MLPQAYLLHHIPGRMRINLPALKGDGWLLPEIRESLSPLPGVRDIETNSLTGSVLLRYSADEFENFGARLAEQAERNGLFTLNLPPRNSGRRLSMQPAEPVNVTGPSEMARAITGIMGEVNTGIKRQTDNIIDLKFLLPVGMAMYGAFKADKRAGTPVRPENLIRPYLATVDSATSSPRRWSSALIRGVPHKGISSESLRMRLRISASIRSRPGCRAFNFQRQ
jgi:hypothetical protein